VANNSESRLRVPWLGSPSVILADEPTGALDSTTSEEIMHMLQQLNREQKLTIIIVTHESDVAAYADRIVTIRDGVVTTDRKNEVPMSNPQIRRVLEPVSDTGRNGLDYRELVKVSLDSLLANRLRTFLTMLGIIIGVASVVSLMTLGNGAVKQLPTSFRH
jgi:macrolide transport system ATP-binding/permease protein